MIVDEIIKHIKSYRVMNTIFLLIFVTICFLSYVSKKDEVVSTTNIFARSDLFYSEIVNQNKKQIRDNLFSRDIGSNAETINAQYADTLLHIRKIDIEGEVVKDFETIMKSRFLIPLFFGYLKDRVEFINFLESNPMSTELIDRIGENISKKYRQKKINRYEVFYNKILSITSEKNRIKINFNGTSNDDVLKIQKLFTSFFLDNFDNRLQDLVIFRDNDTKVKINKELFYTESSETTTPLVFATMSFTILSFLVYLFLVIAINFYLYFFKK